MVKKTHSSVLTSALTDRNSNSTTLYPNEPANLSMLVAYSSETAKLLCSNDKVTVKELWQEDPVVGDIFVSHIAILNLNELKTDAVERLEQLKDTQKKKKEEERILLEQKVNAQREEEEKRVELRRRRIE